MKFQDYKNKLGSFNFVGKEYAFAQDPYISEDGKTYEGLVVGQEYDDEDGYPEFSNHTFKAYWDITGGVQAGFEEDQSNMCDWDKPVNVIAI